MSTRIGVNGVPLSYTVCEKDNPDANGDLTNFIDKTIKFAPLNGDYYEDDSHTVHQALMSSTTGHPSEDCLQNNLRYRDGRRSIKALINYFSGEGNSTRNISKAERLYDYLYYKN